MTKNKRKYKHMSVILFPVSMPQLIKKNGRRLENFQNYIEGRSMKKNREKRMKKNKIK